MQDRHLVQRGSSAGRLRRWLERSLVLAGLAGLIWSAALAADGLIAQRSARRSFDAMLPEAPRPGVPADVPALEAGAALESPSPQRLVKTGSAIAVLSIPRLELSAAVLHGSDAQTLRRGPGHLENTAYPGEAGNVVIAGHRDSFFMPLRHVRVGDDIYLAAAHGRFHYRVSSLRVVDAHDVTVLAATNDATLTLITCYPFWIFGNAPDRFVVRARLVGAPPPAALGEQTLSETEAGEMLAPEEVTPSEPAALPADAGIDDESLVRNAVGRYLWTQGLRLAPANRRSDAPGSVRCEVSSDRERATAKCESGGGASSAPPEPDRTFMLERSGDTWTIRAIVLD